MDENDPQDRCTREQTYIIEHTFLALHFLAERYCIKHSASGEPYLGANYL